MELLGKINEDSYPVFIEQVDEKHFEIKVNSQIYLADCIELSPNLYSLILGEHSYEVHMRRSKRTGKIDAHFYRDTFEIDMNDPMKEILAQSLGGAQKGAQALEAPMPGQVARILVKEGDEVKEDQGIVVLIAMKMENELGSPKAGRVQKILVKEGDSVEGSVPLVIIE